MIKINLIENQVPTQIDLPKRKLNYKPLAVGFSVSLAVVAIVFIVVYFVFVHSFKQKDIVVVDKQKVHIEEKSKEKPSIKVVKKHKLEHNAEQTKKAEKNKIIKEELKAIKKNDSAVFSFDIKLEKIPKKDNGSSEIVLQDIAENKKLEEELVKKKEKKANNKIAVIKKVVDAKKHQEKKTKIKHKATPKPKSKNSNKALNSYYVKITTYKPKILKKELKKIKIKYKIKALDSQVFVSYDIFVGGFDSYKKLVRFSAALKSKGYHLYGIENIGLLFYVCIGRNVSETERNRFVAVWKHTPFRVIAKEKNIKKTKYGFYMHADRQKIKLLKKKGYYPIILSSK
jgi:hypothetical protein